MVYYGFRKAFLRSSSPDNLQPNSWTLFVGLWFTPVIGEFFVSITRTLVPVPCASTHATWCFGMLHSSYISFMSFDCMIEEGNKMLCFLYPSLLVLMCTSCAYILLACLAFCMSIAQIASDLQKPIATSIQWTRIILVKWRLKVTHGALVSFSEKVINRSKVIKFLRLVV